MSYQPKREEMGPGCEGQSQGKGYRYCCGAPIEPLAAQNCYSGFHWQGYTSRPNSNTNMAKSRAQQNQREEPVRVSRPEEINKQELLDRMIKARQEFQRRTQSLEQIPESGLKLKLR